jgi:sulfate adenylyltransferase subunit 2
MLTQTPRLSHLQILEAESIHIIREVAAEFSRPAILYSIGKDSSVLLRLAQKAFAPARMPFPLVHVDTGFKFREMLESNRSAIEANTNPFDLGTGKCCGLLKTHALLDALTENRIDAAMGGARREEERARAKERIYSHRDAHGQWDPRNQRPELWNLFNGRIETGETMRVFPLSNWTELDVWQYIDQEHIPVVPLYFAKEREVLIRGELLIPAEHNPPLRPGERPEKIVCRMRTLGCTYCTGAVRSTASTVSEIIEELLHAARSERENRLIDHDQNASMELKKREGYF